MVGLVDGAQNAVRDIGRAGYLKKVSAGWMPHRQPSVEAILSDTNRPESCQRGRAAGSQKAQRQRLAPTV